MIFCAKSPTLGDKLLSNFLRGRGEAMGRGSFHAKVLVLFIKNGRLPLQLIKKIRKKLALLVACNWLKKSTIKQQKLSFMNKTKYYRN